MSWIQQNAQIPLERETLDRFVFNKSPLRLTGVMEGVIEAGEASKSSSAVALTKRLIHSRMLIGIKDGRFFVGTFYCIDKQGNIILQDAVEYRSTRRSAPSPMEHRGVGLILIPSSCRTSCHVDNSIQDQFSMLSVQDHK